MVVDHIHDVVNELLGQLHKAVRVWDRVEADRFFRQPHLSEEIKPFGQVPEPVVVVDSVSSSEKSTVLEWRTKFAKTHLGPVGKVEGLANTHLIIGGLSIPTRVTARCYPERGISILTPSLKAGARAFRLA